jgi:hypothetical protein
MRLRITADGSKAGTRIVDENDNTVDHVTAVRFEHRAGKEPVVQVDLDLSPAGLLGEGRVHFRGREVRRIIYADGGEEEF